VHAPAPAGHKNDPQWEGSNNLQTKLHKPIKINSLE
jgi:hypothetical protein